MRRVLPLGVPPLRSYLFNLHPLSILCQSSAYLPWFYSRYIQLVYYPDQCLKMLAAPGSTSHRIARAYALDCPLLDVQSLDLNAARQMDSQLVAALERLILAGYYVQVDADFFHLPHRPEFGVRHFLHEVLLHGVDTGQGRFLAWVYGRRGEPGSVQVAYADLGRALADLRLQIFRAAAGSAGEVPTWFDTAMEGRPRIFLYRYREGGVCSFDARSVLEQMDAYLAAHDSSQGYRLSGDAVPGGVWGLGVYGWLHDCLHHLEADATAWNPLTWRVLREHKTSMQDRLEYMERQGHLSTTSLHREYAPVARWARNLLLILMRGASRDAASSTDAREPDPGTAHLAHAARSAHSLLNDMAAREAAVLEQALGVGRAVIGSDGG